MRNEKGVTLILLIVFIALSALIAAPITWHLVGEARFVQLRIDKVKAYNMAYAGVMRACYNWVVSNGTEASRRYAGLETTLAGTVLGYKTGRPANFAYFSFNLGENASWTNSSGGTTGVIRRLRAFRIRNIHNNTAPSSLIVTGAKVIWEPAGTALLADIRLGNVSVIPSGGPFASGTQLTLGNTDANRTRTTGAVWSGNNTYLQWDVAPPDPVKVTIVWTFKDNDSPPSADSDTHEVVFWDGCKLAANCDGAGTPLGRQAQRTFVVTSTGSVNQSLGGGFKVMKTVRATVSGTPSGAVEIIDWRERDGALV